MDYDKAQRELHEAMNKLRNISGEKTIPFEESGSPPYCSFCGKSKDVVDLMIEGPSVHICNECVLLCQSILENNLNKE